VRTWCPRARLPVCIAGRACRTWRNRQGGPVISFTRFEPGTRRASRHASLLAPKWLGGEAMDVAARDAHAPGPGRVPALQALDVLTSRGRKSLPRPRHCADRPGFPFQAALHKPHPDGCVQHPAACAQRPSGYCSGRPCRRFFRDGALASFALCCSTSILAGAPRRTHHGPEWPRGACPRA